MADTVHFTRSGGEAQPGRGYEVIVELFKIFLIASNLASAFSSATLSAKCNLLLFILSSSDIASLYKSLITYFILSPVYDPVTV